MTLKELGYEYLEQEKVLRSRLRKLRELAKAGDDPLLRRRIYYLSQEATHCRKTGKYLISYYEKGGEQ